MTSIELLFWLVAGHFIVDCVLQGPELAKGKNRHIERVSPRMPPWPYWLFAHGVTHGAFVAFITGCVWLGILETLMHCYIDFCKCEKWIGPHTDQWLHLYCKLGYWMFVLLL